MNYPCHSIKVSLLEFNIKLIPRDRTGIKKADPSSQLINNELYFNKTLFVIYHLELLVDDTITGVYLYKVHASRKV